MPINLQNHRTSNEKLMSSGATRQKLHTATSFQKSRKGALNVSRGVRRNGKWLVGGLFLRSSSDTTRVNNANDVRA